MKRHGWSEQDLELTADRCKAIAHPLRLAILCLLGDSEHSVGDICQALGSSQPNISQHLNQLHNQHLLKSRKEANFVYYSIADQRLQQIIAMLQKIYCP
ncbi:MAG: ArsR family transcriptional regulator [Betaproteobacteria bacterium HGW-Betaproteobacteria-12]|nr:MAG: ArsR family transcriptional regulator [Betaproteobacteria bacterium HGW-Betaproteobacteria-12]